MAVAALASLLEGSLEAACQNGTESADNENKSRHSKHEKQSITECVIRRAFLIVGHLISLLTSYLDFNALHRLIKQLLLTCLKARGASNG